MKLLSSVTFTSKNHLNYLEQKDIKYKLKKEGQQKTHRQLAFRSLKDTKKKKKNHNRELFEISHFT